MEKWAEQKEGERRGEGKGDESNGKEREIKKSGGRERSVRR